MNNVLNMQLIEQLTVANKTATTLDMFCQQVHQAFQSQLESFSQLTLYQRQGEDFVGQIQLPDATAVSPTLTSKTHNPLWSAIMENQYHIAESDVYLPLYSHSEPHGILKFTISDTEVQSNIHWSILKTILSHEFHNLLTNDAETSQPQHLSDSVLDITYQISLAEDDTEITNLLFKSLPKSVSHIALYRFDTLLSANHNPDRIRLWTVANRDSTTRIDKTLALDNDTIFSDGLAGKLLDGKFVIKNHTEASTDKLPQALIDSLQSTPIESFVLSGLRAGKQLIGFIVFGSEKPTQIDSQYHHNFRILADQMGITYENQDLLRRTEVSLMETQLLYAITNELALARDIVSMLRVIFLYFGENADNAGLLELEYDSDGLVKEASIRYQLRANDKKVYTPNQAVTDYVPLEELRKLQTTWIVDEFPIYFVEDSSQGTSELPYKLFSIQNIASCILIPLIESEQITHLLSINWAEPHAFNDQSPRILNAVRNQLTIIFENQQLLQNAQNASSQLEQQVQIQRTLNELATFANTHKDEKQLLDKGAETLLKTLPIDHVGIMLIDEDGKFADLMSDIPVRPTDIRRIPVEGEAWERLANGKPQTIEHTAEQTHIPESSKQALDAMDIKSTIFVPFIDISGRLMGSIGLDSFESNISLTDEQIQTAQLINAQLVSQLQNLRLLKNSQLLANQMQQIAKFGETIQARLDLEEILQTTLHFANRILDVNYINIVLYDAGLQKLIVKAYHLDGQDVIIPLNNPIMPIENTVIGAVWKNREPVYVRHMEQSPYQNPHAKDIKTLYAVALISQGVTRGVIEIGRSDTQGIRTMDSSVLLQMANQLAVALENATSYVQNQRLTQNKILANEIALQLQQQMDIDSLLNTTVTELGKALGAKRARIRLGVQQAVGDN